MPCNCDGLEENMLWRKFKEKHNLHFCVDQDGYQVFAILKDGIPSDESIANSMKVLVNKCNMLADILCSVGRAYYAKEGVPEGAIRWWKEHCLLDAARGEPWKVNPEERNAVKEG